MTTTRLTFTIEFHGPFRVGLGEAGPGVDDRAHPDGLIPASSLKGVMRAAARQLLPGTGDSDHWLVDAVFGDRTDHPGRRPSPWSWTDATPPDDDRSPIVTRRARIARDPETGTVDNENHALAIGEQVWADRSTFRILRSGYTGDRRRHELLLTASAQAVHALGAERRRGLGWVTIRRTNDSLRDEDIAELHHLRETTSTAGSTHRHEEA